MTSLRKRGSVISHSRYGQPHLLVRFVLCAIFTLLAACDDSGENPPTDTGTVVDSSTSETSDLVGTDGSSDDLAAADDVDTAADEDTESTGDVDLEDADANSPDVDAPSFEEILGDPSSPTSCEAICTAEGLSCTGEYQNLLGASVAGEALYSDGWTTPLAECDQVPQLTGGGGQMSPLEQITCYCSQP